MRRGSWSGCGILLWAVWLAACGGATGAAPSALARTGQALEQGRFTGAIRWARHLSGEPLTDAQKRGTLARDGEDHLLALYSFTGDLNLGDRVVSAPGGPTSTAIALVRYADVSGRVEWVKVFGPGPDVEGGVFGRQLAVDSQRDILLVVGALNVDLGAGPVNEGEYLLKLDPAGQLLWSHPFEADPGDLTVSALLTDSRNDVILTGTLIGAVDFGSGVISSRPDPAEGFYGPSPFVARFSPDGESLWAYAHSSDFGQGRGAAVDPQGQILLCGSLGPDASDVPFLLQLSPEGRLRWVRSLSVSGGGQANDVAEQGNGVVLTGTFSGTFTFAGGSVVSDNSSPVEDDAFLVAYSLRGEELWARHFGLSGERVAMAPGGGVVVTGTYGQGDDLGLGQLPGEGQRNLFVAQYDHLTGEPLWTRGFPAGAAEPTSLVVARSGASFVLGSFTSGSLAVGGEEWAQESAKDLFLIGLER